MIAIKFAWYMEGAYGCFSGAFAPKPLPLFFP